MNSGTTGMAALHLKRKFKRIEIDENRFNVTRVRIVCYGSRYNGYPQVHFLVLVMITIAKDYEILFVATYTRSYSSINSSVESLGPETKAL